MRLIQDIVDHSPALTAIRKDIHAHPELGFQEVRTSALVASLLGEWGVDRIETGLGKTGVAAVIHGRAGGPSIGLRADMDALPMQEETDLPWRSTRPGLFHGCGHDGHTTMLLGAARSLAATRDFAGSVTLIFQPAEEGLGGAAAMVSDGLFDRFPCDEIYAFHNWPNAPLGWVGSRPGVAMAASDSFDIKLSGRGAHGAMPHKSVDPVMAAVSLAQALQTIVSRNIEPLKTAIVSITRIHSGSAYNVIPETAALHGTIRTFDPAVRVQVLDALERITGGVAAAFGATADVVVHRGYSALVNSAVQTEAACAIAASVVDEALVSPHADPLTGSEDFSEMLARVPGAYLWLGQGDGPELHNPAYRFNDDLIPIGATLFSRIARERLAALAA